MISPLGDRRAANREQGRRRTKVGLSFRHQSTIEVGNLAKENERQVALEIDYDSRSRAFDLTAKQEHERMADLRTILRKLWEIIWPYKNRGESNNNQRDLCRKVK